MLDDEGNLSPGQVQVFLQMLTDREAVFEANLQFQEVWEGWTRGQMKDYFRGKYRWLKAFLEQAVALDEAIICSI